MEPKPFIFSGLSASGKSKLARMLAKENGSLYLQIDTAGRTPDESFRELLAELDLQPERD